MRILHVASEAAPFAQTGGLAQVVGSLPKSLASLGHRVVVMLPFYRCVRDSGMDLRDTGVRVEIPLGAESLTGEVWESRLPETRIPVYLIRQPLFFDRAGLYGTAQGDYADNCKRFAFFCRAVLSAVVQMDLEPNVMHLHDWETALVAVHLRLGRDGPPSIGASTLLTVHNLAYQGRFPASSMDILGLSREHFNWRELEFYGEVNLLKGGLVFADLISTVSERYAEEIQTPAYGCHLEGVLRSRAGELFGVVNGIDNEWDPGHDPAIAAAYSADDLSGKRQCRSALRKDLDLPESDAPIVSMIARLDRQKAPDLVARVLPDLISRGAQFVLLGNGDPLYHRLFEELGQRYPRQTSMNLRFDGSLAHRIQAGADMLLVPSRFEPCGLVQLCALRYGTVPIVHATGGLADTVTDATPDRLRYGTATGFCFEPISEEALLEAVDRALEIFRKPKVWRALMVAGMKKDWSWRASAEEYVQLYRLAVAKRREREEP